MVADGVRACLSVHLRTGCSAPQGRQASEADTPPRFMGFIDRTYRAAADSHLDPCVLANVDSVYLWLSLYTRIKSEEH